MCPLVAQVVAAHWSTYTWPLVAGVFGFLSGILAIHDRFKSHGLALWSSRWGIAYLLLRSGVPLSVFIVLRHFQLLDWHPGLLALTCGVSIESLLRLQLFVKQKASGEEVHLGLFEFVKRFEKIFLDEIQEMLAVRQQTLAERWAPINVAFPDVIHSARERALLSSSDKQPGILAPIHEVEVLYAADPNKQDDRYAVMLAMRLVAVVSERELRRLLEAP